MPRALGPLLALLLVIAGCGQTTGGDRPDEDATLLLNSPPRGVHAGIYLASVRGYDEAEGVTLHVRAPAAPADGAAELAAGRVDMAILDIHDLGRARERGADLVGVMALVQRPLAAVLAEPQVHSPRDLEGRRAGVSGLPADGALLRAVVSGAGGDPRRVRTTRVGLDPVTALLLGRVAAVVTASWDVEGVALQARRPDTRQFRVDDYGAPPYPELVLCVTRETLDERRPVVRAAIRALQRGYLAAQDDPDSALSAMTVADPALQRSALAPQLDAVAPDFTAGAQTFGQLQPAVLRAWARWDQKLGILERPLDVARAFDTTLVGPAPQP